MKYIKIYKLIMAIVVISLVNAENMDNPMVIGKVMLVNDNIVQIKVADTENIQIGDKVNLYHKTSFGSEMDIGEWKVSKIQKQTIIASPIDIYIPPAVGMVSKILISPKKEKINVIRQDHHNAPPMLYSQGNEKSATIVTEDSQPYIDKSKSLANDYDKNRKKYTKVKSDKLWNEIIDNINKAISLGNAEAYFLLAMVYEDGYGDIKADMKKMVDYITKSAEHGYVEAQYMLGEMYADGDEVVKDKEKAIYWYKKAVEQGHEQAKKALDKLVKQPLEIPVKRKGKEPLNYGFGNKDDLYNLLDIEK